jgi:Family of unknown function (DUF5675)
MIVERGPCTATAIFGDLSISNAHVCYTLERPGVEIPAGTYPVTLYFSPHFGRIMPLLENVPGRSYIEIHFGNWPDQSDGCILVGEEQDVVAGDVLDSVVAFDVLFPLVEQAVYGGNCSITVRD